MSNRYDSETGLYYVHARYYNPNLGRFLQTDPIGFQGGNNLYAYVGNDPINLVDPTGLCASASGNGTSASILTASWTTATPTTTLGEIVGELIDPLGGGFPGAIIGSMFGIGFTASYVPSSGNIYAGVIGSFSPALDGGDSLNLSEAYVPPSQNPDSIADGRSYATTFQSNSMLGSTVVESPGSGPPVVGASQGTRAPVSYSASYNVNITPAVNAVVNFVKGVGTSLVNALQGLP